MIVFVSTLLFLIASSHAQDVLWEYRLPKRGPDIQLVGVTENEGAVFVTANDAGTGEIYQLNLAGMLLTSAKTQNQTAFPRGLSQPYKNGFVTLSQDRLNDFQINATAFSAGSLESTLNANTAMSENANCLLVSAAETDLVYSKENADPNDSSGVSLGAMEGSSGTVKFTVPSSDSNIVSCPVVSSDGTVTYYLAKDQDTNQVLMQARNTADGRMVGGNSTTPLGVVNAGPGLDDNNGFLYVSASVTNSSAPGGATYYLARFRTNNLLERVDFVLPETLKSSGGNPAVSPDGKYVYIFDVSSIVCFDVSTPPTATFVFQINMTDKTYTTPYLSKDGSLLIFVESTIQAKYALVFYDALTGASVVNPVSISSVLGLGQVSVNTAENRIYVAYTTSDLSQSDAVVAVSNPLVATVSPAPTIVTTKPPSTAAYNASWRVAFGIVLAVASVMI